MTTGEILLAWAHQLLSILVSAAVIWAIANRLIHTYTGEAGYLCYPDVLAALYAVIMVGVAVKVWLYFVTSHESGA